MPDWIDFTNERAERLRERGPILDRAVARQAVVGELRGAYRFPVESTFRGVVVSERRIRAPASDEDEVPRHRNFLELVPGKLAETAYRLVGGVLVPFDRRLGEGSVLDVTVELWDPARYAIQPPGMLTDLKEARVVVGVVA